MKQGLSLRVSQHLALTPQLQQSIRLLQLSTLEMAQEVEQMLDENPFLERGEDQAEREAFGVEQADAPVSAGEQISELAAEAPDWSPSDGLSTVSVSEPSEDKTDAASPLEESWEGDGSVEMSPDDSEWGGDAPSRNNATGEDEAATAAELARSDESLHAFLHDQARCLRLSEEDQAALYFIIEVDQRRRLFGRWLGGARRVVVAHGHRARGRAQRCGYRVARRGATAIANRAQPRAPHGALRCRRARFGRMFAFANHGAAQHARSPRGHAHLCAAAGVDGQTRRQALVCRLWFGRRAGAHGLGLIARLEPKPGRRFVNLERQVVVPDVLVTRSGRGFKVVLNPEVMPRLRVHDVYANALRQGRGGSSDAANASMQQRLQEARWFIKNIQQRFDTILRVSTAIVERQRNFFMHGELAMRPLVCAKSPTNWRCTSPPSAA